jgi:predicted murein hydrolase (TIGR00659 family)
MSGDFALWVYLSSTPLLWLTVTICVYLMADRASLYVQRHPLANPVLHSVWMLGLVLSLTDTPYRTYFEGAQFVHFMLGPATVALAIPLYANRHVVLRAVPPMLGALAVGGTVALVSAVVIAQALGVPKDVLISLAPKSVTGAVGMAVAESMGGDPALTAVLVISTGIIGAIIVTPLFNLIGVTDMRARGFAAGVAAHGIGTARAFQVSAMAGTFSGIGMGLNAILTPILVPILLPLLVK